MTEHAARLAPGVERRLDTAPNFRDFGGYLTRDGQRRVKRGMLFRSGQLSRLSPADMAWIAEQGIVCVVDLRTTDERLAQPARWQTPPGQRFESAKVSLAGEMSQALADFTTIEGARRGFADFYLRLPDLYAAEYAALFAALAAGSVPLLLKCTAGKDRTGLGAALVLSVLGVGRDAVIANYTETNTRIAELKALRGDAPMAGRAGEVIRQRPMTDAVRDALWQADPALLGATLDAVTAQYGSIDAFVTDKLALGSDGLKTIRATLTEPA